MTLRQLQNESAPGTSANPASARWKAWQCTLGTPGTVQPDAVTSPGADAAGFERRNLAVMRDGYAHVALPPAVHEQAVAVKRRRADGWVHWAYGVDVGRGLALYRATEVVRPAGTSDAPAKLAAAACRCQSSLNNRELTADAG